MSGDFWDLWDKLKEQRVKEVLGLRLRDMEDAVAEVRAKGENPYLRPIYGTSPFIPIARKLLMTEDTTKPTSSCGGEKGTPCKVSKVLKNHPNVLASVDQMIKERHKLNDIISYLDNQGFKGFNKMNLSRHANQHLLEPLDPKPSEISVKGDPSQRRIDSPELTITIPKGIGINREEVKKMLTNFDSREKLFAQLTRLEGWIDYLDSSEGQKVPNAMGHRKNYLDLYKNYIAVIASMKDATGESTMDWDEFFRRMNNKKPPQPPTS